MLFISIPTPCHEKWIEMTPAEQGAFCKVCSKTVVDFTNLSDEEVQNYFLSKRGQKTCGRFRNDQLTDADDPLARILADSIPFWKKFLAIVLVVFGSFLTGCERDVKGEIATKAEKPSVKINESITLGYIMPGQPLEIATEKVEVLVDECSATVGITDVLIGDTIVMPVEAIMGKVVEKIDPVNKKSLDENGNEIRKQE